jgi:hypothetical protein
MLKEEKIFNGGGINSDDAVEYMSPNDLMDAFNIRIQSTESNKQGYVTPIEGNRQVAHNLPTGNNKVVGAKYFASTKRVYLFVENNSGRFRIDEFDAMSKTFTKVFEDMTDTGGNRLLPTDATVKVKDIELIGNKHLFWNHFPQDKVFTLNVEMAKSGGYGTFNVHDLSLTVPPPVSPPWVAYRRSSGSDPSRLGFNNVKNTMMQSRHRYIFRDGRTSVWSAMSNRGVPDTQYTDDGNIIHSDLVQISIDYTAPSGAEYIEIAVRNVNSPWQTVKKTKISDIADMPVVDIAEEIDNPNPNLPPPDLPQFTFDREGKSFFGTTYYYPFFNDGLYTQDDILEHNLLADNIPSKARALGAVNGNTLLLGNLTNGFPQPVIDEAGVSASVELTDPDLVVDSPNTWRITRQRYSEGYDYGHKYYFNTIFGTGAPQIGDIFSITTKRITGVPTNPDEYSYTVGSTTSGDLVTTIDAMVQEINDLPSSSGILGASRAVIDGAQILRISIESFVVIAVSRIQASSAQNILNRSVPALKGGAGYELAIGYYTPEGQPMSLYTSPKLVVTTPHYAESRGQVPEILWTLPEDAPQGAGYYHILTSTNRSYDASWYTITRIEPDSNSTEYQFDLGGLMEYHQDNQGGQPMYDFAEGDYVQIIGNVSSTSEVTNWQDTPVVMESVKSFEVVTDDSDPDLPIIKHILKVEKTSATVIDEDQAVLIEIVRPKRAGSEEKVFYEIGQSFPIVGGKHSQVEGTVSFIDSYVKMRRLEDPSGSGATSRDVIVETFYFSDTFKSDISNIGRPRTTFDVPKGVVNRKAEIVWSGTYNSLTGEGELNRFYPENTYRAGAPYFGPTEDYGGIQYLSNRENRLLCLQESKVGYIPVNRAIISDSVEQQQISISQDLLNPINYSIGPDIGIGNDYCIPSYSFIQGSAYFIDPVERAPVRAGLDGTRYIYFKAESRLKARISRVLASNQYIRSWWDGRFNEWGVGFNDESFIFNEGSNRWFRAGYIPNIGFTANDQLFTSKDGSLWVHDDAVNVANFYGNDSPITLTAPFIGAYVRTFNSVAVHCDKLLITTENGVKTQLGHVSDLREEDFLDPDGLSFANEGVWYANFAPDYNTGEIEGDLLKGRYVTLNLTPATKADRNFRLLKVVVKSTSSTPNE